VVRGVLRPRYAPVLILEDRGSGFSPEVQGTSDSHRGGAGGKKNLVRFRRPGVFAGAMPPAPDQDLQGQVPDFFPGRVLRGLVPGVLCGSETPDKLHDDFQINLGLLVRLLCHASVLLCVLCRSSPRILPRPPRAAWRRRLSRGLVGGLCPPLWNLDNLQDVVRIGGIPSQGSPVECPYLGPPVILVFH